MIFTKEHRENIGLARKGKKLSEKTKRKISESEKGKIVSEKTRLKQSKIRKRLIKEGKVKPYWKGKKRSKKTKEKMGRALKGRLPNSGSFKKGDPKLIKRCKKLRAKQTFPLKDTSIEVKIQDFLKQLGIEFFTHQHINIKHSYQCDILIPSMNLVIECDGDYWHKYPIGNDIDHIRTNELLNKGFKVLRLWEFEIKEIDVHRFKIILDGFDGIGDCSQICWKQYGVVNEKKD